MGRLSENVGHAMTFKVLDEETKNVIDRSNIRTATDPRSRNWRQEIIMSKEDVPMIIRSKVDDDIPKRPQHKQNMPVIPAEEDDPTHVWDSVIGRTFLMKKREDGQRFRARVVKAIDEHDKKLKGDLTRQKVPTECQR